MKLLRRKTSNTLCLFKNNVVVILDVNMMLIGGFGFLMAFVRRFTFSAVGLTFICVTFVTEWTILLEGFKKVGHQEESEPYDGPSYTFPVTFHR